MIVNWHFCNEGQGLVIRIYPVLFALVFAFPVFAGLPETIESVRPSIVSVGIARLAKRVGDNKPTVEYRGTGFVVGNGRQIITNAHVLPQNLKEDSAAQLVVFVGRGERAKAVPAKLERSDEAHDLALLSIVSKPLAALKLSSRKVREGQEVAFTGFPIGMVLGMYPSTNKGIISAITPIVQPAISSRTLTAAQIKRMRTPYNVYQLDAIAYPGNSGSPVYDPETGEVLAVVNSVFVKDSKEGALKQPSGITYAIPVKYVKELLAQ